MKTDIHPQYFANAKVVCACGNTFTTGSTREEMHIEICSNCHPFYTGHQKLLDTAGTIEKFRKKQSQARAKVPKKSKA
jgi:large subunit ribosomal protein L31